MGDNHLIEVRWHGRGGQGAVTSAELVALAVINEGKYAQSFPSFGPERRGAPVLAFLRVSPEPIRIRTDIYQPDMVVILDPSLLRSVNITSGLKENGKIIINSRKTPQEIRAEFGFKWPVATVNATAIARELLGLPITNTTMIGALLKIVPLVSLDSMTEPVQHRFKRAAEVNLKAMRKAYQEILIVE